MIIENSATGTLLLFLYLLSFHFASREAEASQREKRDVKPEKEKKRGTVSAC